MHVNHYRPDVTAVGEASGGLLIVEVIFERDIRIAPPRTTPRMFHNRRGVLASLPATTENHGSENARRTNGMLPEKSGINHHGFRPLHGVAARRSLYRPRVFRPRGKSNRPLTASKSVRIAGDRVGARRRYTSQPGRVRVAAVILEKEGNRE